MTRLNVAIIGAGIGREHLQAYLQLPSQFFVKTLCDVNFERAKSVVGNRGSTAIETDFDAVLADGDIDIIDVCLPPHLHFESCMKALEAGKHVVCEKPLVSSLKDADLLAQQVTKTGRILAPIFQYRFGKGIAVLKALVGSGLAGKPFAASIETHWNRDSEYYANPWRGTWEGEQGGAVLGHAIHNHDLLCSILGPVKRLYAMTATRVNDIEVEDCAAISFEMGNGAMATSSISLGASDDTTRLRFCFENLTAESGEVPYAPAEGDWSFCARGNQDQATLDEIVEKLSGVKSGFVGYFQALHELVTAGTGDAVTLEDGRRSLELVTAIYHSARNNVPVEFPLFEGHPLYDGWVPAA